MHPLGVSLVTFFVFPFSGSFDPLLPPSSANGRFQVRHRSPGRPEGGKNLFVIPPAGAQRSSLRRPPCDGGRPLGRNARRAPGASRRFPGTSRAGAPPDVSFFCRGGRPRFLAKEVFVERFTFPPFRFTVQFVSVLRFPSANGRFQFRHRSPAAFASLLLHFPSAHESAALLRFSSANGRFQSRHAVTPPPGGKLL